MDVTDLISVAFVRYRGFPNLFFLFSGEMGMHLDNRIPIHQIHSCCYAKAQATEQIRQEPKDKGNEIPHIEKFGLQLIVIRGAK